jgi:DNA-binding CsgD family transcriptional regulator
MAYDVASIDLSSRMDACTSMEDFLALVQEFIDEVYRPAAFVAYSFAVDPEGGAAPIDPIYSTFPKEMKEYYHKHDCVRHDPYVRAALASDTPVIFSELLPDVQRTQIVKPIFDMMYERGMIDGVAMQGSGRPGRLTYFAMAFEHSMADLTEAEKRQMKAYLGIFLRRGQDFIGPAGGKSMSQRERQLMMLLAKGASNKEIARTLDISPHTVNTHLDRCFKKMGVHTRMEAVLSASKQGMVLAA